MEVEFRLSEFVRNIVVRFNVKWVLSYGGREWCGQMDPLLKKAQLLLSNGECSDIDFYRRGN